ncbi:MAG TPA: ABC transporter permease [Candidatus Acidoferrales bacterium]|nr:ABC transporter permease [Candidatus Acidoferrales bacterium]
MESLWKDIRFGLRMLIQKPGFTAIAVLTLALGIGANTAIFTLFDAVLLESLPVREPGRLALFTNNSSEGTSSGSVPTGQWTYFSYESYDFLRKQSLPFESLCAFRAGEGPVSVRFEGSGADGQVARAIAHLVSGNYFTVMGVDSAIGRTLTPDDDKPNAPPVAVVSNGYWKQRLNSDPAAVGKVAILNGTAFTIVGVTPPEFFGERVRRPPDYWVPLVFQPQIELRESYLEKKDTYWLYLMGRLRPGATRDQAQAASTVALQQFLTFNAGTKLTDENKATIAKTYIRLYDGGAGISGLRLNYSQPLRVLLVVVVMVLLIACANVGNLLLSRAVSRRAEITVRLAMGASRGRLIRQLLTESVLLAALGAGGGMLLAVWAIAALVSVVAPNAPIHPHLNGLVLGFTLGITLASGILFGLAPALQAGKTDLVTALKLGGGRVAGNRKKVGLTQALVVGQIAISLVLLVGASLFARSLLNMEKLPLGFNQENVLLARLNPRIAGYKPAEVGALYRKLYDRLSALPGVEAATLASYSPLSGSNSTSSLNIQGYVEKPHESPEAQRIYVGPNYPKALGMPLLLGREIGLQDTPGAPKVAMVNEAFVRSYFPKENPIGHRFSFEGSKDQADIEIIGVLKDAQFENVQKKIQETVFQALLQDQSQFALSAEVELRTARDPGGMASVVRTAIGQEDSKLPISGVQSLREQVEGNFNQERLAARLVSFFGGLALLLACLGLYGVVAQGVSRRTNEIGIRMALGAQRGRILWMVFRDTMLLLIAGLAVGIPAAVGATRLIANQLFGLGPWDALSFVLAILILGLVTALAGFLPARRASRVDPIVALRYE